MFGWGTRKTRDQVGAVAAFGKIPAASDFIRAQPASQEMTAFDAWVGRAVAQAERDAGGGWGSAFDSGPTYGFVWSAASSGKVRSVLAGVLAPSRDAVGRRYPVAICLPLPFAPVAPAPQLLPLLLGEFFLRARSAAHLAMAARSTGEFQAIVDATLPPSLDSLPLHAASYAQRTRAMAIRDVLGGLFADGALGAEHAVHTILEATAPYRGRDAPPLHLAVRAPTGTDPLASSAAWMDVVRAAAAWKENVPSCFVALDERTPGLLLHLGGEAPATLLADAWSATPSDRVCVLEDWAPNSRLATPLPDDVTRLLQDGSAPFGELVAALEARPT